MASIVETLTHYRRRAATRLRGESDIEGLIAAGLRIGKEPHLGRPLYLDGVFPWLITIGDYVTFGQCVQVITHDTSLAQYTGQTRLAPVVIGDRVFLGSGSIILPGTTIGDDCVISAGAVVHGEIPEQSLVRGNPAEVSPVKAAAAWQRADASRSPEFPTESPQLSGAALRQAQREVLSGGGSGYVPARAAPGSPHAAANGAAARS